MNTRSISHIIASYGFMAAFTMAMGALLPYQLNAQSKVDDIFSKPKFSGYMMGQYQSTIKDQDNSNGFNLRIARLSVTGRVLEDFEYKIQGQINGNTSTMGDSPRIVDLYTEWQKYSFAKIKVGQFKRPFTFENPMNPIDQGFMGYSQNVNKLAGFGDRHRNHSSNGRDIGIQLQGDLLKTSSGRSLVHYQIGVFNGQGINVKDVDNKKDIIGGAWVSPVKGLRIGAFGWTGSYARKDKGTNNIVSLNQHRYAFSVEYKNADWQLRSEYIHSTGGAFKNSDENDATLNSGIGNKADGVYALCIAPIIKGKLRAKCRYDLYRQSAEWSSSRTQYEVGLNWLLHKNLEIQSEYALINDRQLANHNYSVIDLEFCVRF